MEVNCRNTTGENSFSTTKTLTTEESSFDQTMPDNEIKRGYIENPHERIPYKIKGRPIEEIIDCHPFLFIDNPKRDGIYPLEGIRILSHESLNRPLQVLYRDMKSARLLQDNKLRMSGTQYATGNGSDNMYFMKPDDTKQISIDGANVGKHFGKASKKAYAEIRNPVVDARTGVKIDFTNDEATGEREIKNHDGVMTKTGYRTRDETGIRNQRKSDRFDFCHPDDERCNQSEEKVNIDKAHESFDRCGQNMLENNCKPKVKSENNIYREQFAESITPNRSKITTKYNRQETVVGYTFKKKQSHVLESDIVLVKFRGKLQLIRRKDYNKILSKLKSKSTSFTRNNTSDSSSETFKNFNEGRKERLFNSKVDYDIDKLWKPLSDNTSREVHHNASNDLVPECSMFKSRDTSQMYRQFHPVSCRSGSMLINGNSDFGTEKEGVNRMDAKDADILPTDCITIDLEESRKQAQKLFRWHAERYFNKFESI